MSSLAQVVFLACSWFLVYSNPVWREDHFSIVIDSDGSIKDLIEDECVTAEPVIGILTQDLEGFEDQSIYHSNRSYIPAPYVKYIESAGGQVVPIHVGQDKDYYDKLLPQLNGALFPGGMQELEDSTFTDAARIVLAYSISRKRAGENFPVWGTCQGFQVLVHLIAGKNLLADTNAWDMPAPIGFESAYEDLVSGSRLFRKLDFKTYSEMISKPVTIHFHYFGLTKENFTSNENLQDFFRILASNNDQDGLEFISVIESKEYPVYATIFHPEDPPFDHVHRNKHKHVPHSPSAVRTSQYFANFFVNECRKSPNRITSPELRSALLHHTNPKDTERKDTSWNQMYFFPLKATRKIEKTM